MPLPRSFDALEAAPEALRPHLIEKDGRYVLDVEGVVDASEVEGLKRNRDQLLKEKKALADRAATLPPDFDPERWKAMTEAEQEREKRQAEEKGQYQKLLAESQTKAEKQIAAEKERAEKYRAAIANKAVTVAAQAALAGQVIEPAYLDLLMLQLRTEADFEEDPETGDFRERYKDPSGGHRLNKSGDPMTTSEYVEAVLRPKFANLFRGSQASGGGAVQANARGATVRNINDLSPAAKLREGLKARAASRR